MNEEENIIDTFEDFEIEFGDDPDDELLIQNEKMIRDFRRFYRQVDNFLNNLSKNPQAETMKWPNRAKDITEFRKLIMKLVGDYIENNG